MQIIFFLFNFSGATFKLLCDQLTSIQLTVAEVTNALQNLAPRNARGSDDIPGTLLKNTANEIAPSLCQLFNVSLSLGSIPSFWKRTNVSPVFKKDDHTLAENYTNQFRCCAMFHSPRTLCFQPLLPSLIFFCYHLKHSFLKGKSTVTQLLEVYQDILDSLTGDREVDVIHLEISKAFVKCPHHLL